VFFDELNQADTYFTFPHMTESSFRFTPFTMNAQQLDKNITQRREDQHLQKRIKVQIYADQVIQMFNEKAAIASEWPIEIFADPVRDDDDALAILEPMFKANGFAISVVKREPGHFVIRKAE
jgi:hypothetical protein